MSTRVLLIDSDINFMVGIKQALEDTGEFEVGISASGLAAEDALSNNWHDIAVIAFNIPDMDVIELISQLRYTQPELPVILCPQTAHEQERVRYIDAQGAIQKPYVARDLIPYVRSIMIRLRSRKRSARPQMPDALRDLVQEDSPADQESPYATLPLEQTGPEAATSTLPDDPHQTRVLPEDALPLSEVETDLMGWYETDDLSGERVPDDFDEVLNVVADLPPPDRYRTPDDRAFRELVDSMRQGARDDIGSQLADLLAMMEPGTPEGESTRALPDNALDYVLDAIRRGTSPLHPVGEGSSELDDATIGDVIQSLFDPSFQSVLAALSGEEINEEAIAEPTYSTSDQEGTPDVVIGPQEGDRIAVHQMAADEDSPAWLARYEAEGIEPPESLPETLPGEPAIIDEPPVKRGDSSSYPATHALHAVTEVDDDTFSLDDLLSQIEEQIPIARSQHPRLKPLPSWGQDELPDHQMHAMFDHLEGTSPSGTPDLPSMSSLELADMPEETQPSPAIWDEGEGFPSEEDMIEYLTQPAPTPEPPAPQGNILSVDDLYAMADQPADTDEAEYVAEPELDMDWVADALADQPADTGEPEYFSEPEPDMDLVADALADQPADTGEPEYFSEPEPDMDWVADMLADQPADTGEPEYFSEPEPDMDRAADAVADQPADTGEPEYVAEPEPDMDVAAVLADQVELLSEPGPDEKHLIQVPVKTAARMLSGDVSGEEDDLIAHAAIQLTQFSLESSAQATLLSRPGQLLARAGNLHDAEMNELFQIVDDAWQANETRPRSMVRYIRLAKAGQFLLYTTRVEGGMVLSMVFSAYTPLGIIRRQAQRLSESLDFVPEDEETAARPEAATLPSRPTEPKPPRDMYKALGETLDTGAQEQLAAAAPPVEEPANVPYIGYACLWLPDDDPTLELTGTFADDLHTWIEEIAEENAWEVEHLDVQADFVQLALRVPSDTLPDSAVAHLMTETTQRCQTSYPDVVRKRADLWASGYYVTTPPRALTEREIASFITFQRQSQADN
ncbi:MAG: response regulator [Anaerolineae bacterium]|nr:response regulator [Anaerolineae bacterium]